MAAENFLEAFDCKGFFENGDGIAAGRFGDLFLVEMAGDDGNGEPGASVVELFDEAEPSHAGHAQVDEEEADPVGAADGEEFLGGGEALDGDAEHPHKNLEGVADGVIIIDDVDGRDGG